MPKRRFRERLLLLLSWREKAQRLSRGADGGLASKRALYLTHVHEAEFYLERLRASEQMTLMNLGEHLLSA